ncbi:hypothetical protein PLESTM_001361600 [Pleodorina starrii]|nr:hypothetical protein PLESTM_001361600 [Pleodorina starrii]
MHACIHLSIHLSTRPFQQQQHPKQPSPNGREGPSHPDDYHHHHHHHHNTDNSGVDRIPRRLNPKTPPYHTNKPTKKVAQAGNSASNTAAPTADWAGKPPAMRPLRSPSLHEPRCTRV